MQEFGIGHDGFFRRRALLDGAASAEFYRLPDGKKKGRLPVGGGLYSCCSLNLCNLPWVGRY
jgi:hypothetical protein